MKNHKKIKSFYKKIIDMSEQDNMMDIIEFEQDRFSSQIIEEAKNKVEIVRWYEEYGIKLDLDKKLHNNSFCKINEYISFNYFNDADADRKAGRGRFITNSENGKQPKDEWLLNLSFCTGAYIFGEDSKEQKILFEEFFNELKNYTPDYCDNLNDSLYWNLDNSKQIYEIFNSILKKYNDKNKSQFNKRKIRKAKEELDRLTKLDALQKGEVR